MSITKKGFTLVEVTLFLAITGLILIGTLSVTWSAISRQRTNGAVQDFVDFLSAQYSSTTNIQSNGTGQSKKAIYGKVLTFGEKDKKDVIHIYDLIGDVVSSESIINLSVPEMLIKVNADVVVTSEQVSSSQCRYSVINQSTYSAKYGASVKKLLFENDSYQPLEELSDGGSLLIVRSPSSGTIHTYVLEKAIEVQEFLGRQESNILRCELSPFKDALYEPAIGRLDYAKFKTGTIHFCLQPSDSPLARSYDINLKKDSSNSTGISVTNLDADDNPCAQ